MSQAMPEDFLDAIEQVMDQEFNDGAHAAEEPTVEVGEARKDTPDLTFDAQGRAHGPDGKFVPLRDAPETGDSEAEAIPTDVGIEPEAEATEGEAPDSPEVSDEEEDAYVLEIDDPELLELVDTKYGGDIVAALRGLREAQSLIGRQGNELGDLRSQVEQIPQLLQQMFAQQQAAQSVDWDELIEEDPEQAVYMAAQMQNPGAMQQALSTWAQSDPFSAFMFLQQASQPAPPEPPSLEQAVDGLKGKYPDLNERLPAIEQEAAKRPALARLLQDQDPETRVQALEDLYVLSGGREQALETPRKAARQVLLRAKAEADSAKSDAAVVSASNTSAAVAAPTNPNQGLQQVLRDLSGLDDLEIV